MDWLETFRYSIINGYSHWSDGRFSEKAGRMHRENGNYLTNVTFRKLYNNFERKLIISMSPDYNFNVQ